MVAADESLATLHHAVDVVTLTPDQFSALGEAGNTVTGSRYPDMSPASSGPE